jgi:hypothetical protein
MATRQGQFMVYSQGAPKEQLDIINIKDYKLRVTKTWVDSTNEWHVKFTSQSVYDHSFEMFLSHEQLKLLREFL